MKIAVVCQHYWPEPYQLHEACAALVGRGHDVYVLTGLPNYPDGIIPEEYRHGKNRRQEKDGVHICRAALIPRRNTKIGLAVNYFSFAFSACLKAWVMPKDFDVVYVFQTSPVTMAWPALVLKKRCGCRLLLHCADLWPESMKTMLDSEKHFAFRIMDGVSRRIYRRCDRIAVTSRPFIDYLREKHGIPCERMCYIPSYMHNERRYEALDNGVADFAFMGNMGFAQGLDCILDAVEINKELPGFHVHFVGEGSCLNECKRYVSEHKLDGLVTFHGRFPISEMYRFYELADVCMLTLKKGSAIGLTLPAKLQGYMSAGKPVIAAVNGAAKEVIEESGCGRCVDAGDSEALAGLMREFIMYPDRYKDCGEKGRAYHAAHFTKDIYMDAIEGTLKALCNG